MYQKRDLRKNVCIFYKKEEAFIPPLAEVGVFCLDLDKVVIDLLDLSCVYKD